MTLLHLDPTRMWGCAFAKQLENGTYLFVRLSESRELVDIVILGCEVSLLHGELVDRALLRVAQLLRTDKSTMMHLCPKCCSSDMFVRAGFAHAFYINQAEDTASGHALRCSRMHEVSAAEVRDGLRVGKIGGNSEGLSEAGRQWIANQLQVPLHDVREMEMRLSAGDQSLNAPLGENSEDEWQDFLADPGPNPEDIVIGLKDSSTRSKWLAEALGGLSPREQTIIRQRRLSEEAVTLEELGRELGVSKERVRQIEQRALNKLRDSMLRKVGDQPGFHAGA